jgi:hypothetical protein
MIAGVLGIAAVTATVVAWRTADLLG